MRLTCGTRLCGSPAARTAGACPSAPAPSGRTRGVARHSPVAAGSRLCTHGGQNGPAFKCRKTRGLRDLGVVYPAKRSSKGHTYPLGRVVYFQAQRPTLSNPAGGLLCRRRAGDVHHQSRGARTREGPGGGKERAKARFSLPRMCRGGVPPRSRRAAARAVPQCGAWSFARSLEPPVTARMSTRKAGGCKACCTHQAPLKLTA